MPSTGAAVPVEGVGRGYGRRKPKSDTLTNAGVFLAVYSDHVPLGRNRITLTTDLPQGHESNCVLESVVRRVPGYIS